MIAPVALDSSLPPPLPSPMDRRDHHVEQLKRIRPFAGLSLSVHLRR